MQGDADILGPWRRWLAQHDAWPVPGIPQAWAADVRGVEVVLEVVPEALDRAGVRVVVPLPADLDGLSIVSVTHALDTRKRSLTGDALFDRAVVMHLPDARLFGALDRGTRDRIRTLVGRGGAALGRALRLEPWATSWIGAEAFGSDADRDRYVANAIDDMVALAIALRVDPASARQGLARILEHETDASVRETYERMFGLAAEVRDARARLQASGMGDTAGASQARLGLLTTQARDGSLGAAVRQEALVRLLAEFALSRIGEAFVDIPSAIGEVLVPRVIAHARAAREIAERRAGARILTRLVRRWPMLPVEVAASILEVSAPSGEPELLPLCVRCLGLGLDALVAPSVLCLLRMQRPAEDILLALPDELVARVMRAAPGCALTEPEAVGALFLALFGRVRDEDSELVARYLQAIGSAQRHQRPDRAQYAALLRPYLASPHAPVQLAAIDALAQAGEVGDLGRLAPFTEGMFRSVRIKAAARRAVATIRERARERAEVGALALSDGLEGGLAEPDRDES